MEKQAVTRDTLHKTVRHCLNRFRAVDALQHMLELFELLRVLIDRPQCVNRMGQYLLLGSASPFAVLPMSLVWVRA